MTYKATEGTMCFSEALFSLKRGGRVCRRGWNGKGMFLFAIPGRESTIQAGHPLFDIYTAGDPIKYTPVAYMKTADGAIVPWLCSQTDMFAEDWEEALIPFGAKP